MTMTHYEALTLDNFIPSAYDQLVKSASCQLRSERRDKLYEPCELVHDAYLRLRSSRCEPFPSVTYAFGAFHKAMRRCLIEHGRAASSFKRGGGRCRVPLADEVVVVNPTDMMAALSVFGAVTVTSRSGQAFLLRLVDGHTAHEISGILDVSLATVRSDLAKVRKHVQAELGHSGPGGNSVPRTEFVAAKRYVTAPTELVAQPAEPLPEYA